MFKKSVTEEDFNRLNEVIHALEQRLQFVEQKNAALETNNQYLAQQLGETNQKLINFMNAFQENGIKIENERREVDENLRQELLATIDKKHLFLSNTICEVENKLTGEFIGRSAEAALHRQIHYLKIKEELATEFDCRFSAILREVDEKNEWIYVGNLRACEPCFINKNTQVNCMGSLFTQQTPGGGSTLPRHFYLKGLKQIKSLQTFDVTFICNYQSVVFENEVEPTQYPFVLSPNSLTPEQRRDSNWCKNIKDQWINFFSFIDNSNFKLVYNRKEYYDNGVPIRKFIESEWDINS